MHPLAAIVLVILTGLAWLGTVVTLLVSLSNARRRPPDGAGGDRQGPKVRSRDGERTRIPL
ncbi:MAG: hypothetical protein HOQ04_05515 [Pseudarthrobacter sp.]|nr:hypothetical protein [Pseudarthrobacter sp.]